MPTYTFPRPMLTVDIAIFQQCGAQVQVLLIQRRQNPCAGSWALPGGFVNMDETLEQSAVRELEEETGLVVPDLEQDPKVILASSGKTSHLIEELLNGLK